MSNLNGLESIAPAILRFPIENTVKAIVNLTLGRKRTNSVVRLLSVVAGLLIGYNFPQIGNVMAFLISLVTVTPISAVVASSISMASSMFLSVVVLMYLAKKSMQYYYINKYGFSNPEYRFTKKDRTLYVAKYIDLPPEDYKKLITRVESMISFLVNEINRFDITGQAQQKKSVKYVLNCVKRGDLTAFGDFYAEEVSRQPANPSARQQRLAKLLADEAQADSTRDSALVIIPAPIADVVKKDAEKPIPNASTKLLYDAKRKAARRQPVAPTNDVVPTPEKEEEEAQALPSLFG